MPDGLEPLQLDPQPKGRAISPGSIDRLYKSVATSAVRFAGLKAGTPSTKEEGINRRGIKGQKNNSSILGFLRRRVVDSSLDVSKEYVSAIAGAKCFEL